MILVDANILMYAAGTEHPNKAPSLGFLEGIAAGRIDGALDAEVLQEVLHRYRAIGRWDSGKAVYDQARRVFTVVLPITADVLDGARRLLDEVGEISARDALHAAVVDLYDLEGICSYDRGLEGIRDLRRMEPDPLNPE